MIFDHLLDNKFTQPSLQNIDKVEPNFINKMLSIQMSSHHKLLLRQRIHVQLKSLLRPFIYACAVKNEILPRIQYPSNSIEPFRIKGSLRAPHKERIRRRRPAREKNCDGPMMELTARAQWICFCVLQAAPS